MKRLIRMYAQPIVGLCVFFFLTTARSEPASAASQALARAEERSLAESSMWWTLGHYHKTFTGRVQSRIDDQAFFLADDGKTNPGAELSATIKAMFEVWQPATTNETRSIACRYPARWAWLKTELGLQDEDLPESDCAVYLQTIAHLNPKSLTVVYPAAYLNSPASMFGHLLLAIDSSERSRLLSKAVNYAAAVDTAVGPVFAFKGIFGLYQGTYSILPYYDKVEEYSAVSKRDIWEYELDLSPVELDRALRHIWELQNIWSRYFFFKENCAFNLLYPLQASRPGLDLVGQVGLHATPVEMLRLIVEQDLIRERVYRPSQTRKLMDLAEQHVKDPSERNRLQFELELLKHRYSEQEISPEEYRETSFPLMRQRAKLGKAPKRVLPEPPAPETCHGPGRFRLSSGTKNGEPFSRVGLRTVHHGWLDPTTGFEPGAYISFFEAAADLDWNQNLLFLNQATLVSVESYSPGNNLVSPISWSFRLGADGPVLDSDHHWAGAELSSGKSFGGDAVLCYLMWANRFGFDSASREAGLWQSGGRLGILWNHGNLQVGVRHNSLSPLFESGFWRHESDAGVMLEIQKDTSLGIQFSRLQQKREAVESIRFIWSRTF